MDRKIARICNIRLIEAMAWLALASWLALYAAPAGSAEAGDPLQKVRAFRADHEQEILSEFVQLLAIPNVASDRANIRRNAEAIAMMMARRGLAPRLLESDEAPGTPPLIFGEWQVPHARRTLVLYAHYDGQPVNAAEWVTGPWTPTLRTTTLGAGGSIIQTDSPGSTEGEVRLYARGSGDDKAGIVVILSAIEALRALHRTPTDSLKIVFEGEEEAGSPHLAQLLTQHRLLFDAQLWVICDGPVHPSGRKEITYGARGDMNVDLTVYGPNRPLHSGHYGNWAPNPALYLARLLASMKDETGRVTVAGWYDGIVPLGEMERRAMAATTEYDTTLRRDLGFAAPESDATLAESVALPSLNINGMRSANVADQAANVIPDTATAVLDLRLVVGNAPESQYEKLRAHVRSQGYYVIDREPTSEERLAHPLIATMKSRPGLYAAARMPMNDPLARAVAESVRLAAGEPIVELPTSGGSLPLSIISKALGAPAMVVSIANYDDNQHAANENLRLANLWEGIDLYAAILMHRAPR
jgi:acetylornithine deacetylase/succinyl-diaminopimelate desuccinylase-like protein